MFGDLQFISWDLRVTWPYRHNHISIIIIIILISKNICSKAANWWTLNQWEKITMETVNVHTSLLFISSVLFIHSFCLSHCWDGISQYRKRCQFSIQTETTGTQEAEPQESGTTFGIEDREHCLPSSNIWFVLGAKTLVHSLIQS